uniref:Uncharacterized protein n=1 Tax=Cucumis melo TaxID=3656 RepID=A0A9I9EHE1_CUCME
MRSFVHRGIVFTHRVSEPKVQRQRLWNLSLYLKPSSSKSLSF